MQLRGPIDRSSTSSNCGQWCYVLRGGGGTSNGSMVKEGVDLVRTRGVEGWESLCDEMAPAAEARSYLSGRRGLPICEAYLSAEFNSR